MDVGLPVHDALRPRLFPWVNLTLLLINLWIFAYEVTAGPAAMALVRWLAMYPQDVLSPAAWVAQSGWPLVTLITSTFVHASWAHVIGNMLFLYVFGDNVESLLGHGRYLLFYLLGGVVAGVAQALADPGSQIATVGASGAVAAVMGAYVYRYPRVKVLTLIPSLLYFPVNLPAWAVLGLWFLLQLFGGLTPMDAIHAHDGVAFWAHISGFVGGMGLIGLMHTPRPQGQPRP
jgi:membrane associated rhomboid family serine protease